MSSQLIHRYIHMSSSSNNINRASTGASKATGASIASSRILGSSKEWLFWLFLANFGLDAPEKVKHEGKPTSNQKKVLDRVLKTFQLSGYVFDIKYDYSFRIPGPKYFFKYVKTHGALTNENGDAICIFMFRKYPYVPDRELVDTDDKAIDRLPDKMEFTNTLLSKLVFLKCGFAIVDDGKSTLLLEFNPEQAIDMTRKNPGFLATPFAHTMWTLDDTDPSYFQNYYMYLADAIRKADHKRKVMGGVEFQTLYESICEFKKM